MVKHSVTVQGDPAITYQILTDFGKYLEWYPECELCQPISVNGTATDVDLQLGGMKVARMVMRYDCQPNSSVVYNMVSSKDLKGFSGSYRIIDSGNGSHVVNMETDLTASVPKFVTDRMMKSSLEKQGKQFQERNKKFGAAAVAVAAAPASDSTTSSALPAARPGNERVKRPRCLLRVRTSGEGVKIWYAGSEFQKTSQA